MSRAVHTPWSARLSRGSSSGELKTQNKCEFSKSNLYILLESDTTRSDYILFGVLERNIFIMIFDFFTNKYHVSDISNLHRDFRIYFSTSENPNIVQQSNFDSHEALQMNSYYNQRPSDEALPRGTKVVSVLRKATSNKPRQATAFLRS